MTITVIYRDSQPREVFTDAELISVSPAVAAIRVSTSIRGAKTVLIPWDLIWRVERDS